MEYEEIFTGTVKEFQSKFKEIQDGYEGTEDPGYLGYIFEDTEEAELLREQFSSLAGREQIEIIKPDPDELKNSETEILDMGREIISNMSAEISVKLDLLDSKYTRSGESIPELENFIKDSKDAIGKLESDDLDQIKKSRDELEAIEIGLSENIKELDQKKRPPSPTPKPPSPTPKPPSPTPKPPSPTPKTVPIRILDENEFKVMTYNVEFDDRQTERFDAIAEVINFESPDILAIQEGGWIYGFDRITLDGYENGDNVVASRNKNSRTILYYNSQKFTKLGEAVKSDPRGISGTKLEHINTGKVLCVVSFHLEHYPGTEFPDGKNSTEKTRSLFQEILRDLRYQIGDHVILMGDSNEFFQNILEESKKEDMNANPDPFKIAVSGGYQVSINFRDGEQKSCCVPISVQRANPGTGVYAYRSDIIGSDLENFDVELSKKELEMSKKEVFSDHRPIIGYFKLEDDRPGEYEFFEYNGGRSDRENKSRFGFRKTGESQLYECRVDVSDQSLKDFFTTLMNMKGVTVAIVTYNEEFAIVGFLDYLFNGDKSKIREIVISTPRNNTSSGNGPNKNKQLNWLKRKYVVSDNSQIVLVDDSDPNIKSAKTDARPAFRTLQVYTDENFSNRKESEIFNMIYENGDKKFIAGFDFDDTLVHGHAYYKITDPMIKEGDASPQEFARRFSATDMGSDPLPTSSGERIRIADGERDNKDYKYVPQPIGYENYTQVKSVKNLSDILLRLSVDSGREDKIREKMREALSQKPRRINMGSPLKLRRENKKLNEIRRQRSERMSKIRKLKTSSSK